MSRIAYVNGAYVAAEDARVGVEDRGFQFADGVYEVWGVRGGRLLDAAGHTARLWRSLRELEITPPFTAAALDLIVHEVMRRNRLSNGLVYLQVTRGEAPRDFPFPRPPRRASVIVLAKPLDPRVLEARAQAGVALKSHPDIRWGRCDIKSVALLPNVLAKEAAKRAGAFEALLVDKEGLVTEGASSSAWIVTQDGRLVTRGLDANILPGCTRATLIEVARSLQLPVEERPFSLEEAKAAAEAFISAASAGAMPVIAIDGARIGGGRPGPITLRLREAYAEAALE